MDEAVSVLNAVAILHSPSSDANSRRQADAYLSAWRASPSSWRTALFCLLQPSVQLADTDRYFFACCLRFACQRSSGDILDPSILGSIIDQTSLALLSSVFRQSHAVSNQLAIALAALAVRSTNWDATRIVPDFASLFQRSAQSMHEVAPEAPPAACVPLDLVPCLALLQLLQALLTEARNKQCSVHPGRRSAVASALASSPEPIRWVRLALAVQGPHAAACSIQGLALVEEYCNQGSPPVGLDSHEDLLAAICQRVLNPDTAKAASQCMAAAFTAAGPDPAKAAAAATTATATATAATRPRTGTSVGAGGGSWAAATPRDLKLLFQLLQHWQATGYTVPRPRATDPQPDGQPQPPPSGPDAGTLPTEVMLSACSVLSSACTVLLRPALGPPAGAQGPPQARARSPLGPQASISAELRIQQASIVGYQHYFQLMAEQLLMHLQHCDDEVALVAAAFFSGTYLPELKTVLLPAASPEHRQALLDQHAPLLQRLTESLVLRTQLRPEVAAVATADARDIPDDARTVRRELAGMLRDISSLVGHTAMLQFMAALVQPGFQQLEHAAPSANGPGKARFQGWVRLECALYAANVVTGRWVSETWNARKTMGGVPSAPSAMRQRPGLRRMVAGLAEGNEDEEEEDETDEEDMDEGDDDTDDDDDEGSGSVAPALEEAVAVLAGPAAGAAGAGAGAGAMDMSGPGGAGAAAGGVGAGEGAAQGQAGPNRRWAPPRRSRSNLAVGSEADAAVAKLVEIAAISSVHPNGSCKLAGTALTLLGGLSCWYADKVARAAKAAQRNSLGSLSSAVAAALASTPHTASLPPIRSQSSPLGPEEAAQSHAAGSGGLLPIPAVVVGGAYSRSQSSPLQEPGDPGAGAAQQQSPLPSVLLAVMQAIKSEDAKLSRNGATTLQRLCAHEGLARHLLANHSGWVDNLVSVYQTRGGMLQRAGPHEDSSTEELLLMTLCRLACLSGGNRQLLLHLATPQVQAVRQALAELAAANDAAAAPGSAGTLFGAAAGLTCASLVSHCSKSLDILTAIMESCRLGGRGALSRGEGGGGSNSGRGIGGPPPTAAVASADGATGGTGADASAAAMAAADQVLGLTRAVWWVLHEGLQPKLLQSHGSDLATGVSTFMAAAMKTFLAASRVLPPGAQLPPPPLAAAGAPAPGSGESGAAGAGGEAGGPLPTTATQLLLEPLTWAMNLLEVVPVLLLSTPRIVDLLLSCLDALAALQQQQHAGGGLAGAASSAGASTGSSSGSSGSGAPGAGAGSSAGGGAGGLGAVDLTALTDRLGTVVSGALVAGFANLVNPLTASQVDSVHTSSLLRLCCSCMRLLPACFVHSPSTPDLLLSATLVACYSLDMDQCRAAMDWCQCLCTQPFGGAPPAPPIRPLSPGMGGTMAPPPPPPPPPPQVPLSPSAVAAYASLRTWLDGTAGAKVVQALLLSASGSMPSCLVLPVSTALHRIWRGVGTDRFLRWADMAMIMLVPSPPSPWQHLKPEHRSALLRDLVSPECLHDIPRFKRVVKSLCGGKRKGEGGPGLGGTHHLSGGRTAARASISSRSLGQDRSMGMGASEHLMHHFVPDRVRSLSRERLIIPSMQHSMQHSMQLHGGLTGMGMGMGMNAMAQGMNVNVNAMAPGMSALNQGLGAAMGQSLLQQAPQLVQLGGMSQLPIGMHAASHAFQQHPHTHGGGVNWLDMAGQAQYNMLMGALPQAQYGGLPMGMSPHAMTYLQQQQQQQQQGPRR